MAKVITGLHNWTADLPVDVKNEIANASVQESFKAGESIYRLGDPVRRVFEIVEGRIKLVSFTEDGRELLITNLYAGDTVGINGILTDLPHANQGISLTDVRILSIAKADFLQLFHDHKEVSQKICRLFSFRMRLFEQLLGESAMLNISQRVQRTLVRIAQERGVRESDGSITITELSQEQLSTMLGATRQSIGRAIKDLQAKGEIKQSYGKISIVDFQQMIEASAPLVGLEPIFPGYERD